MHPTRLAAPLLVALLSACAPAPAPQPAAPAPPSVAERPDVWLGAPTAEPEAAPAPPPPRTEEPKDFGEELKLLYRVAACGSEDPLPPGFDVRVVAAHCLEIRPKIEMYRRQYVALAKPFLEKLEPPGLPAKVVYPFGGGDLVTALTTYPAATEVTTVSLELVGDPRRIRRLDAASLELSLKHLRQVMSELLFVDDYSKSETLKRTQRGDIPGELGLFLAGLVVHGYEPVSLRYFSLNPDGSIRYLTARDIEAADHTLAQNRKATWTPPDFSEAFANAEISFRQRGAGPDAPLRVHRHIAANLADDHLRADPSLLHHLEQKGTVSAMTKAASYLLWSDAFSSIRSYLLGNMAFMVSDSTGIPPVFAGSAGFVQETYGSFRVSLLHANAGYNKAFRELWQSQPRRKLPFRYGYLSAKQTHLLVTRKAASP